MATSLGGFSVEEIAPPQLEFTRTGTIRGTRTFRCAWDDAKRIAEFLLPHSATPDRGPVIVTDSQQWPGIPGLRVASVSIVGFDGEYPFTDDADAVATCGAGARLTAEYATSDTTQNTGTDSGGAAIVSLSTQVSGEVLLTGTYFNWASDDSLNQFADINCGIYCPSIDYVVVVHQSPLLPLQQWQETIGRINTSAMPLLGNAPAETVLFSGANANRTVATPTVNDDSAGLWELELHFTQRFIPDLEDGETVYRGWNHLYRPRVGWDKPKLSNGKFLYDTADLNELFTPPVPTEED